MAEFFVTEQLETLQCADCAMTFAMPQRFMKDRRNDHKTFYCPAGRIRRASTFIHQRRRNQDQEPRRQRCLSMLQSDLFRSASAYEGPASELHRGGSGMTSPEQRRIERAAEAIYREFENRPLYAQAQINCIIADELAKAAITAYLGDEYVVVPKYPLLPSTVSCSGTDITIQCNDPDVKDTIFASLTAAQSEQKND